MDKLDFVRKLYRGKNCYSDPLTPEEIEIIHIRSTTEKIINQMLEDRKIIFLTGNPLYYLSLFQHKHLPY